MRVVAGRCADVWFSEALSDCTLSCHRRNGAGPRAETAHSDHFLSQGHGPVVDSPGF